ncbi:hypothetical protein HYALB_00010124 [Hymenoscyphus albidus]|uniref:3-phytase n=1 Tax=Hymenoscyphus albidus TaxID=595503 RepID=A0A9N9L9K5_9HELO|nr:hypothetical protein HYALB_00010124 [Hymenoscyphus albidus]
MRCILLSSRFLFLAAVGVLSQTTVFSTNLAISAKTSEVESDNTAIYYSTEPLLLGNDGLAATGGFHVYSLPTGSNSTLVEKEWKTPGRTKLLATVYDIGGKDLILTIAQPDSIIRAFEVNGLQEVEEARKSALGDWSALCTWKSAASGNQYFYLFGKKQVVRYLTRKNSIHTFNIPIEANSCSASAVTGQVYFSTDDGKEIYTFKATESTSIPEIEVLGEAEDGVTGLAIYVSQSSEYLLLGQKDSILVSTTNFSILGSMKIAGVEDPEVSGFSIFQGCLADYRAGYIAFALEDSEKKQFAISSLESAFQALNLSVNTAYDPAFTSKDLITPICDDCNSSGFCAETATTNSCECFAGFAGDCCENFTCIDNCSGHGVCVGANECECQPGWGGLHCSFLLVEPEIDTTANGGDGDDPAVWISPISPDQSRIITTTKSEQGAGLGVFDLQGKLLQAFPAGEPNNVDMIYNFPLGNNVTSDLAYAACRADNTLCLFAMSPNGTLSDIAGGIQTLPEDYEPYGSCSYKSPKTGTQYLFVNNKKAEYLQYSLKSTLNGTLSTNLVRSFIGGSGGQVEGCVTDEENGYIFIGEEPSALWRYDAEPETSTPEGTKIASVSTYSDFKPGYLYSDVEGVTFIPGKNSTQGYIIVSCQGVSAYNVYERAPPHAFVKTFTIVNSKGGVDHVSNTDGITAVGNRLNEQFPSGLIVVHDDSNELATGGTSDEASFKLVGLSDVLDELELGNIDPEWNPRN